MYVLMLPTTNVEHLDAQCVGCLVSFSVVGCGGESCVDCKHPGFWQGEERDSSDEEWEAAYAAMDPMAQIGWVHRIAEANAGGADVVRDVFVAADEMHDHAMSEMDGNTQSEEANWGVVDGGAEATSSQHTDGSAEHSDSEEAEMEGEMPFDGLYCPLRCVTSARGETLCSPIMREAIHLNRFRM